MFKDIQSKLAKFFSPMRLLVLIISMIAITISTLSGGETYIDRIARERAEKDIYMKSNGESPIKKDDRKNLR